MFVKHLETGGFNALLESWTAKWMD